MVNGKIYKITNLVNGKIYIGQTTRSVNERWKYHCSRAGECVKITRAIRKYGKEAFRIEIIDTASSMDDLNNKEEAWIQKYDSIVAGYNLQSGGDSKLQSDETKKKVGAATRARCSDPQYMKKFKRSRIAMWQNPEYRRNKMNQIRSRTPLEKQKFSDINRAAHQFQSVPVVGVNVKTGAIVRFESLHLAAAAGFHRYAINFCLDGTYRQHKGFTWRLGKG